MRIVSVGECTIDNYLNHEKQFIGGISLNFAVNAKQSGAQTVSLVSRIGDDHDARILQRLASEGIDASHVCVSHGRTAMQKIELQANGERIFPAGGYDPGVLKDYRLSENDIAFIKSHDVLASAFFKQVEPVFKQAISAFDGWRGVDFLDLSDYNRDLGILEIYCSRLQVAFLSGDAKIVEPLSALSRETACVIVATLGPAGSIAFVKGESVHQPAVRIETPVDSTGCGDAFQAAFTVSYWRDLDIRKALAAGALQAARVLQHMGAIG
jgi:fructoselysine 6-kinase